MKGLFLVLFLLLGTALEDATCFSRVLGDIGRRAFSLSMAQVTGGSVVALVTPMNSDYSVDFASLRSLLRWHVEKGTKGAVILGTTGEASTIDLETRTLIIKEAVSTVAGEMPIIVGTGTTDPTTALALSQNAKDCGADATLVITPYYVKPPQRALIKHFTDLANSVDIPMILYNCPGILSSYIFLALPSCFLCQISEENYDPPASRLPLVGRPDTSVHRMTNRVS
jgi:hypothetical protein